MADRPAEVIGIYSGTFDPVHSGHLSFAKQAVSQCGLAKVYFLVEARPRRKQGVKALEHRQAMVGLAIQDEPQLGSIIIDQARFSVTRTMPVLQARLAGYQLAFLMGDDMLSYFTDDQWPHVDEFINSVQLVIGVRQRPRREVQDHIRVIEKTRAIKMRYHLFQADQAVPNSTAIRRQLRQGQRPEHIDEPVYHYIRQHGLYQPASRD